MPEDVNSRIQSHGSAKETREVNYERLRQQGFSREVSRDIAENSARIVHDTHSKR